MEPVTHVLTGACLARAGLNRRAAYATLAMAVAAELPDIDVLWGVRGPVYAFQHHRGSTHTLLGVPFEAAFVLALIYGLHRWRTARASSRHRATSGPSVANRNHPRPLTAVPVRWGVLYLLTLIALLSHLLLDYTNSYGLRLFFPLRPHWYAASIVSIFDPLIFALLLLALVVPSIFRLVSAEVGAKRSPFAAPGWAAGALFLVLILWGARWVEHERAIQLAMAQSLETAPPELDSPTASQPGSSQPSESPSPVFLTARRALASPDPLSIFRWYTVTDFGPVYQLERADTSQQSIVATEGTYAKANPTPAILAAESSQLGRAYLDWSPMPILTVDRSQAAIEQAVSPVNVDPPANGTVVIFRDPRFMGVLPWRGDDRIPPLTGVVVLDQSQRVVLQSIGDHAQTDR